MSGQRGNNLCSSHKLSLLVLSLLVVFISSINSVPLDEQRELEPETHSKYYNYDQLTDLLKSLAQKYANIANLTSIGRSVENRELWVMRITRDPTADGPGKPKFKYVGNMHGDETVSRQVLIYLLEDLLEKYGEAAAGHRAGRQHRYLYHAEHEPRWFWEVYGGGLYGQRRGSE